MKTLLKQLVLVLLFIVTACNSKGNNTNKNGDVDIDPKFLSSMVVVDNGNLETEIGGLIDFSIKLNNDNPFVRTDDQPVNYIVEVLDQNGKSPEWLDKNDNKTVLTKSNSQWKLSFAPRTIQEGMVSIIVTRKNINTKQDVTIPFKAVAHILTDDFVTTDNLSPRFTTNLPAKLTLKFNPNATEIKNDKIGTTYQVSIVDNDGNDFADNEVLFESASFVKSASSEMISKDIAVMPKISKKMTVFKIKIERVMEGKSTVFMQKSKHTFSILSINPDSSNWVVTGQTITLSKGKDAKNFIKVTLNKDADGVKNYPSGTKYQVVILNEKGEKFDDLVLHSEPVTIISSGLSDKEDSKQIPVNSQLVTDGAVPFTFKVIRQDQDILLQRDMYHFIVTGDKSDSVTAPATDIELDRDIPGVITVKLNNDSEAVHFDTTGTTYQISIVNAKGETFDKKILDAKEVTLVKGEVDKIDIPVSSATVADGAVYKLKFVRGTTTTIQRADYNFIVHDADQVLAHPKEITIPQGSDGVSLLVSLNPDSSTVAQDADGTTYKVSLVDEQGNAFSAETVTANTVTLTKGSKLSDVITLTSNNLSDWKNCKLLIESSSNRKITSRILYKFNVVVANQAPFDVTKANINSKSDAPVWLGGDKKSFYGYSEYQVEDLQINDLGLVVANLFTTDPITEDAPTSRYLPFIITDTLKKSVANFNTCPVGEDLVLEMQAITRFSSSGGVLAYEPICHNASTDSFYSSGLYFYGKNNNYYRVKTIDNRYPTLINSVSNNGRYIVSTYNGFNNNYGVFDLDKDAVNIFKMANGDEITTSKSDVYGVSDSGLVILQNTNDADNTVRLISCDSNNGNCKQLQQFSAGFEYAKLSSNGKYLYVVLNNSSSTKHFRSANKKQRLLVANGSYKVVTIDLDNGTIIPIAALNNLTHYPDLAVTNTGTLIVNYTSYDDPMIYLVSGKVVNGSALASKLGVISSLHIFMNISDNGKYVVFAAVETKSSGNDATEFSAISRRYMKDGIDEVIKGM